MERIKKNKRWAAILLIMLEVFALVCLGLNSYKEHIVTITQASIPITMQLFVVIGFGFGFVAWLRFQVSGMYWVLVVHCISVQIFLSVQYFQKQQIGMQEWVKSFKASLTNLIGLSSLIPSISPLGLVLFAMFGMGSQIGLYFFLRTFRIDSIDTGGTIFIFLFGSIYGLLASQLERMLRPSNRTQHLRLREPSYTSKIFQNFGMLFLLIFWPQFASSQIQPQCARINIEINTIFIIFGGLFAAIISGFCLRGQSHLSVTFYLQGGIIGAISVGANLQTFANIGFPFLYSFTLTFLSIAIGHYFDITRLTNIKNPAAVALCKTIAIPAFIGSFISCLGLYSFSFNIKKLRALNYNCQFPIVQIYQQIGLTVLASQQFFTIVCVLFLVFVTGFIMRVILTIFSLDENSNNSQYQNMEIGEANPLDYQVVEQRDPEQILGIEF